jgi:flagellin-like protein
MINNKKGLSTIITTLIIILMVLVAIGIVWYAVLPMVKGGSQQVNYANLCMGIDLKAVIGAPCTLQEGGEPEETFSCPVNITRTSTSTTTAIDGVGLTFSTDTETLEEIPEPGDVTTKRIVTIEGIALNPTEVSVRAYFEDEDGEKHFCTATQQ